MYKSRILCYDPRRLPRNEPCNSRFRFRTSAWFRYAALHASLLLTLVVMVARIENYDRPIKVKTELLEITNRTLQFGVNLQNSRSDTPFSSHTFAS